MLTSRRFVIALFALGSLTLLGVMKTEPVASAIAAVAIGLAGANAAQEALRRKK